MLLHLLNGNTFKTFTAVLVALLIFLAGNALIRINEAPRITIGGDNNAPITAFPPDHEVAIGACQDPKTQITYVTTAFGGYYEATYDSPTIRYDLTWQRDGTTVAVESLQGGQGKLWAEQIGPDFWNCVASRSYDIKQKQVTH